MRSLLGTIAVAILAVASTAYARSTGELPLADGFNVYAGVLCDCQRGTITDEDRKSFVIPYHCYDARKRPLRPLLKTYYHPTEKLVYTKETDEQVLSACRKDFPDVKFVPSFR